MLRIVDYNYPSDEESQWRFITLAKILMIRSDYAENDVSKDDVDTSSVLVHALPVHYTSITTLTDPSQPMMLTILNGMHECLVEAL